jgi:hypothetical protein
MIDVESGEVVRVAVRDCACDLDQVLTQLVAMVAGDLAGIEPAARPPTPTVLPPMAKPPVAQTRATFPLVSDYYLQGRADGARDGEGRYVWFLGGAACSIVGVGASYVMKPDPPTAALMGKSAEYAMGYTEGYRKVSQEKNTTYAWYGCAADVVAYLVFFIVNPNF